VGHASAEVLLVLGTGQGHGGVAGEHQADVL
jgi:hypothetical protein